MSISGVRNRLHPSVADLGMPVGVAKLLLDGRGFPVPWFVHWQDGVPDFRVVGPGKVERAVREGLCWICGEPFVLPRVAFVVGPMCAVNRTSAEPPSHLACARYAAKACPFLARPQARRREGGMPEQSATPGIALKRNPGVALVWVTDRITLKGDGRGGTLFHLDDAKHVEWWAHGREATRDEVETSIDSGLPVLEDMAAAEGPVALAELAQLTTAAKALMPA